jgi:zinc ribbon protein
MALTKCKECSHEVSTEAKTCPNCGAKVAQNIGCITLLVVLFAAGLVVVAIISQRNRPSTPGSHSSAKSPRDEALESVSIKNYNVYKGGFDNVMMITVTIENKGKRTVKDIEITCTLAAKSGTIIDRNRQTIFETLPAGGRKTIRNFNMGFIHPQAAQSSCEITNLVVL